MLPSKFKARMHELLGEDYEKFKAALEMPAVRGIRVNETKITTDRFKEATELSLEPLSYASYGFIPASCEGIGRSAEHHAGMFYVQDPGAMATVTALDVKPGWRVLDTCAAPGGKSSQLASLIGEKGFLHANEYVPKRAKIIVSNFERLGIKNALVTSLDTRELANMYDSYFDLVLCDAPCSGEGMFRKYDEALDEWSPEKVSACAERQSEILDNCANLVAPGGYLLYSTCTYSVEENEERVSIFLENHPSFEIVPVSDGLISVTSPGIKLAGADTELARRFYPHVSRGEGQFIALLKRSDTQEYRKAVLYKDSAVSPTKTELEAIGIFFKQNMKKAPAGRIIRQGSGFALIPEEMPLPPRSVFMAGVMIGELRGKNFIPHHQLFSAYGCEFLRRENLARADERVEKYLHGEEIPAIECGEPGYVAVTYEGVALGGGKASGGVIKNHYPKGLRNN